MNEETRSKRTLRNVADHVPSDHVEFDREFVADSFRPPSPKAKSRWQKAKRKRGRPTEGEGAKIISVSIERRLLELSDAQAKAMGISRARFIARGLRAILASQGITVP